MSIIPPIMPSFVFLYLVKLPSYVFNVCTCQLEVHYSTLKWALWPQMPTSDVEMQ